MSVDKADLREPIHNRHYYSRYRGEAWQLFYVPRLWELSQPLPVFEVPVVLFNTNVNVWFRRRRATFARVLEHTRRIQEANLSYPIILCAAGNIMDGYHRLAKALLIGLPEVSVIQFAKDPDPDQVASRRPIRSASIESYLTASTLQLLRSLAE